MGLAKELYERLQDLEVKRVTVEDGDYKGTKTNDVYVTIGDKVHQFQFAKDLKLTPIHAEAIVRSYIKDSPAGS
jgi:hypothetical protein